MNGDICASKCSSSNKDIHSIQNLVIVVVSPDLNLGNICIQPCTGEDQPQSIPSYSHRIRRIGNRLQRNHPDILIVLEEVLFYCRSSKVRNCLTGRSTSGYTFKSSVGLSRIFYNFFIYLYIPGRQETESGIYGNYCICRAYRTEKCCGNSCYIIPGDCESSWFGIYLKKSGGCRENSKLHCLIGILHCYITGCLYFGSQSVSGYCCVLDAISDEVALSSSCYLLLLS
ncbi:hypothetical protein ES705_30507 [subsurface metagenome]